MDNRATSRTCLMSDPHAVRPSTNRPYDELVRNTRTKPHSDPRNECTDAGSINALEFKFGMSTFQPKCAQARSKTLGNTASIAVYAAKAKHGFNNRKNTVL